jgi:hypothetical protein
MDCEDDIFFEDIIVFCSKAALRVQRLVKQAENLDRQTMLKKLSLLKTNGEINDNFDEIQAIENRLNQQEERINSDKVTNYLKTTVLNDEKITPQFLRLAKTLHTDSLEKYARIMKNRLLARKIEKNILSTSIKNCIVYRRICQQIFQTVSKIFWVCKYVEIR